MVGERIRTKRQHVLDANGSGDMCNKVQTTSWVTHDNVNDQLRLTNGVQNQGQRITGADHRSAPVFWPGGHYAGIPNSYGDRDPHCPESR